MLTISKFDVTNILEICSKEMEIIIRTKEQQQQVNYYYFTI